MLFAFYDRFCIPWTQKKRSRWVSSTLRRSSTQIRTETLWSNKCSIQMQNTGRDGMEMLHCVLLNGLLGLSPCLYLVLLCSWYQVILGIQSNGMDWIALNLIKIRMVLTGNLLCVAFVLTKKILEISWKKFHWWKV